MQFLTRGGGSAIFEATGDIAQLGERLDGIEKVRGSSPLISSKQKAMTFRELWPFLFLRGENL